MPAPKREKLLETAEFLFSKEGFKGISADRILKETGVAKMTLYKGFKNKDDLICETLRRRANRLSQHIDEVTREAGENARNRLLRCFDAMQIWSERTDFNGCYFINALGEFSNENSTAGKIARQYKAQFLSRLEEQCIACEVKDPQSLAQNILMLIDGATVAHMTLGDKNSYNRAKSIASQLLSTV